MKRIESILTRHPCYAAGRTIAIKGLMLHSVGCSQPSASVFVREWNNPGYERACVHAFIDGSTGDVYQPSPGITAVGIAAPVPAAKVPTTPTSESKCANRPASHTPAGRASLSFALTCPLQKRWQSEPMKRRSNSLPFCAGGMALTLWGTV